MENLSLGITLHEEKVKGKKVFVAESETLGISDYGESVDEAIQNIKNAAKLLIEEFPEKRKLLIQETPVLLTRIFL